MSEKQRKPTHWIYLNELRTGYIFQCYYENTKEYNETSTTTHKPTLVEFISYVRHYIEFMKKEFSGVTILCKKSNYKFI